MMVFNLKETKQKFKQRMTGKKPKRFVLIIGAMKSGTTSLFEILSQHTQICPSKEKEPDYFTKNRDNQSRDKYLSLWDWKDDLHSIALESSVAYTKAPFIPGVPVNIYKSGLGSYRFIYMIRNPITRIESQVRHGLFAGWGKSLDKGITDDLIAFSRYAMQVKNYLKYFSKNDILLIPLEEFQLEPNEVLRRICCFLDVDPQFNFSKVEEPRNSGSFFNGSPFIARLTQGGIGKFVSRKVLPTRIKTWLRKKITNLDKGGKKSSSIGRWKLTPEEKSRVLDRLADDLKMLKEEFDVDVHKFWQIPPELLERS